MELNILKVAMFVNNTSLQKQVDYLNNILADVLKSFWDERGRGARYRTTLIGVDRFVSLNANRHEQNFYDISMVMQNIEAYLESHSIISKLSYNQRQDFSEIIDIQIYGCLHLGMERKLFKNGIKEPLACPCANLVMHLMEKSLGLSAELAEIKIGDDDICKLCIAVFIPNVQKD